MAEATVDRANLRVQKLKLTDDGRPATLSALGDERASLTKNERIKIEKPGPKVWNDVVENYSKNGFDAISEDDMERFKWIGVYQQRPKDGHFMMRIKVAGGQLSTAQLRAVSNVARTYADSIADITTRQTFQIHWLTIENMPAVMDVLGDAQMGVKHEFFGACGDICRNIVSSPLTGVDALDEIDPTSFFNEANQFFSSNLDYADLPRKYKAAIVGHRAGAQCEINDISFYGVKRSDGRTGYGLMVGGGLSTEPHIAKDLGVFIAPEDGMTVMEAVTRIFRDHGYRKSRKHARFKFLVADWGVEKVRAELETLLGRKLEDAETTPTNVAGYQDRYGVHAQQQEGLSFVGVPVIGGRLTSDQMDEIAAIADECGSGEVRLTVMQSFYIVNVPNEKVSEVVARLAHIGFPVDVSAVRGGVVACTGIQYCNLAVTETKQRAKDLVQLLDNGVKWTDSEFFRINVNGCPNSCGQHWIADVGLQGCSKKIDGELVEHYDVFLGGALGTDARFNRRIKRVPASDVAATIQRAINHYQGSKQGDETFAKWVERHSDEELETFL
ncbi:MAG TPA: nitrite/sulfite reductase [Abditibacteriaceae bacterium]|jgi:sulfite reductase beta subunit-like hemoprotein